MNYKLKSALGYMLHSAVKQRLASWRFPKMWIKERRHAAEDPAKQKKRRHKSVLAILPTGCVTFIVKNIISNSGILNAAIHTNSLSKCAIYSDFKGL